MYKFVDFMRLKISIILIFYRLAHKVVVLCYTLEKLCYICLGLFFWNTPNLDMVLGKNYIQSI